MCWNPPQSDPARGLDCGTDNKSSWTTPLYLGLREKRVRGQQYDDLVDTFVRAARELYPSAYIHFEDFGLANGKFSPASLNLQVPSKVAWSWRN